MIVDSTFTVGGAETDGRVYVDEVHKLENGREFTYRWLSDGTVDIQMVVTERAAIIIAEINKREASRLQVTGTEVPYTKHEFLSRFTAQERIAIRTRAKTDDNLNDFMEMLNASGGVYMTLARQGISYLQAVGILTAERAAIIGED